MTTRHFASNKLRTMKCPDTFARPFKVVEKRDKNDFDTKINIFIVWMGITAIIVSGTIYQPIKASRKLRALSVMTFKRRISEPFRFIVIFLLIRDEWYNPHIPHKSTGPTYFAFNGRPRGLFPIAKCTIIPHAMSRHYFICDTCARGSILIGQFHVVSWPFCT